MISKGKGLSKGLPMTFLKCRKVLSHLWKPIGYSIVWPCCVLGTTHCMRIRNKPYESSRKCCPDIIYINMPKVTLSIWASRQVVCAICMLHAQIKRQSFMFQCITHARHARSREPMEGAGNSHAKHRPPPIGGTLKSIIGSKRWQDSWLKSGKLAW